MRNFKFFEDNEVGWEGASWIYRRIPTRTRHEIVVEEHYGIRSFLSQFPSHEIINVHSIVGPNGVVHNRLNEDIGWGFDITRDLFKVTWIRFLE